MPILLLCRSTTYCARYFILLNGITNYTKRHCYMQGHIWTIFSKRFYIWIRYYSKTITNIPFLSRGTSVQCIIAKWSHKNWYYCYEFLAVQDIIAEWGQKYSKHHCYMQSTSEQDIFYKRETRSSEQDIILNVQSKKKYTISKQGDICARHYC